MSVGVFGTIYGADFKYEPTFSLNVGGTPTFKILLLPIPSSLVTVGEDMWGVYYHFQVCYLGLDASGQN